MRKLFSPTPTVGLFIALWLILLIGGRSKFFQDPGTFWHTVVGEQILGSKGFFDKDEFSFTFAGKRWIPHQWLGECIMALVHRIDGLDSLLLLAATLLAATFALLGRRLMSIGGLHPTLAVVLVALAVGASSGHFHVRPHLATIVCFAITCALLNDVEAERATINRLFWLIPLFLVWTNCHGGVLGGMVTLLVAGLGWLLTWMIGWDSPFQGSKQVAIFGVVFIGSISTALVNPYGQLLPHTWWEIYQMPLLPDLIQEHAPVNWREPPSWMIIGFGVVYLALLSGVRIGEMRVTWLIPLLWFGLALMRVRHAPLFAVSALVAIADFFPATRWAEKLQASGSDLYVQPDGSPDPVTIRDRLFGLIVPVALIGIAIVCQLGRISVPVIGHGWAHLDERIWPVELLDELREHQYDRPGGSHIFNEYAYGGFLIYYAPGYRVFVDDRCELYGDRWLAEFVAGIDIAPGAYIAEWEKRYGRFDFALVRTNPPGHEPTVDNYFQNAPGWKELKRTNTATFYQRE